MSVPQARHPTAAVSADLRERIAAAGDRISAHVRKTPLLPILSGGSGTLTLGKAENLQVTGSFKDRGALNKVLLCLDAGATTIVTASSGNHGIAVAHAARLVGLPCTVYAPVGASSAKLARIEAFGAEIVTGGDALGGELDARDRADREPGTAYISPYNDLDVVAGQGTVGLELVEQCDVPPDALFIAVGGGGLATGIAAVVRPAWPDCRIIGCFPAASPTLARSVDAGRIVHLDVGDTLSDGTAGNLEDDTVTLPLYRDLVEESLVVHEPDIAAAMRRVLLDEHLLIEGAAAVAVAAALLCADRGYDRSVVVLCGGNVGADVVAGVL